MNEYLVLEKGHLLTIMVPVMYMLGHIYNYQKIYFKNKFKKRLIIGSVIFALITTPIFYFKNYGLYFCVMWGSIWSTGYISALISTIFVRKYLIEYDYRDITTIDIMSFLFNLAIGMFLIVLPYTNIFYLIGGGIDNRTVFISKIVFFLWGISLIFFNKITTNFISKVANC